MVRILGTGMKASLLYYLLEGPEGLDIVDQ